MMTMPSKLTLYTAAALLTLCVSAGLSQAQTLDFSFRISDTYYGPYDPNYNFVTGYGSSSGSVGVDGETAGSSESDLVDNQGNDTGFTLTINTPFSNAANFGGTGATPENNFGYSDAAAEGLMSGNGSGFTLSDLDPSKTYTFTFYGALNQYVNADPTTYNGWATDNVTYNVTGANSGSGTIDISHNSSQLATIYDIVPDSNGDITVVAPFVNVMTVSEDITPPTAPEPSSTALLVLGGAVLFVYVRRQSRA